MREQSPENNGVEAKGKNELALDYVEGVAYIECATPHLSCYKMGH